MAQQINLNSPILLTPQRVFSARAMAQALALLVLGLIAICVWAALATRTLRHELDAAAAAHDGEMQRLNAALQARAPGGDLSALSQELGEAGRHLAERRALLAELVPPPGQAHARSSMLELIAQTVPDAVWLSEVRLREGQLRLAGSTLQPPALRRWLEELASAPALAGQSLRQVKVERKDTTAPDSGVTGVESWTFEVVSQREEGSRP